MRRLIAIPVSCALLLCLSMPLLIAWRSGSESSLPACCRGNGKHHCMMRMRMPHSSEPGFQAPAEKCPLLPQAFLAALLHGDHFVLPSARTAIAIAPMQRTAATRSDRTVLPIRECAHPKRGPPARS